MAWRRLLGLHKNISFEGQAAMGLEALAVDFSANGALQASADNAYHFDIRADGDAFALELFPAICEIIQELETGKAKGQIAMRFHYTLALALTAMAVKIRQETGLERVVMSGGCFQNKLLLAGCEQELRKQGFAVFTHRRIPANDGGVSLGQALIAAAQCGQDLILPPFHFPQTRKDYGL